MIKKIQEKTESYVQFTPEEIESFGWKENQKLTITEEEDGTIIMRPYTKVEIDLGEFDRNILEELIHQSCERDVSVNEVIEEVLREIIKENDKT
jgi:bifunctional DNA-binding transcriptional regulator/antitoxin component of YhaV-PrlF toxin-antitoxin module